MVYEMAINDLLAGKFVWHIVDGAYSARVSRLDSPNGGLVVITWKSSQVAMQKPWSVVRLIDEWLAEQIIPYHDTYYSRDDELGQEFRLALKVRDARNAYWARAKEAQEQAMAQTA